jgi:cyclase
MKTFRVLITFVALLFTLPLQAQPADLDEAIRTTEITSQSITDDFHVLFGVGGNIAVSIGEQGVLIVDSQFPGLIPKIQTKINELGGGDIDFAINTHWHFDHADGNQILGPQGTWLIAHENSRDMMAKDNLINLVAEVRQQPAYMAEALPVATFGDRMTFHFNGEEVDLIHAGPAHTNGDAAVIFRGYNAVHMGDVFNNSGYPFVDADNDGSLPGIIDFCQAVLDTIDRGTVVIPGHGAIAGYAELEAYIEMLEVIRDRIASLIADGASLEQVIAMAPTAEWDDEKGDPGSFINRAYASMTP